MNNLGGEVSLHIDAAPSVVWDLISDVTRIGEFSPETFEAEWTDGATGPAVGAKFRGHVKRTGTGAVYWAPCLVRKCEPEKLFEFAVMIGGKPANNWGYRLEAKDGGTLVTEYFRLPAAPLSKAYWFLFGKGRGKTNQYGMQTTLERMKAVAEAA